MDNLADISIMEYDQDTAERASAIRKAGWEQNPEWPTDAEEFETWPPEGQMSEMTLTRAQWELIATSSAASAEIYDAIAAESDSGEGEDEDWAGIAADCRRIAEFVTAELAK